MFLQSRPRHGMGAALAGGVTRRRRRSAAANGWIIPTNKPDRFNLKVMAFNPIPAPDPKTWELTIEGAGEPGVRLNAGDLDKLPRVAQSSRLKCVQCWSGRVNWEGFRAAGAAAPDRREDRPARGSASIARTSTTTS